jgi:hypothetical protein
MALRVPKRGHPVIVPVAYIPQHSGYSLCLYSVYFLQTMLLVAFIFTLGNFHHVKLLTGETNLIRTSSICPVSFSTAQ